MCKHWWGGNAARMEHQFLTGHHAHTHSHSHSHSYRKFRLSAVYEYLIGMFWEAGGNPDGHRESMWNPTQTVTQPEHRTEPETLELWGGNDIHCSAVTHIATQCELLQQIKVTCSGFSHYSLLQGFIKLPSTFKNHRNKKKEKEDKTFIFKLSEMWICKKKIKYYLQTNSIINM